MTRAFRGVCLASGILCTLAVADRVDAQIAVPFQVVPRQSAPPDRINHVVLMADVLAANHDVFASDAVAYPSVVRLFFVGERLRLYGGVGRLVVDGVSRRGLTVGAGGGYALRRIERVWHLGIELQGGVGYTALDHVGSPNFEQWDVPLGVGLSFLGPLPFSLNASIWATVRGQVRVTDTFDPTDDVTRTRSGAGAALGVMLEYVGGNWSGPSLGLQAGVDWLSLPNDEYPAGGDHELAFTVGLFARFSQIPS